MQAILFFFLCYLSISQVFGRVIEIGGETQVDNDTLFDLPLGIKLLENQVGGHIFKKDDRGMLKDKDGSVLKATMEERICGVREIEFYENLMGESSDPNIVALRTLVPEYRGTVKIPFRGKVLDFIKLEDIMQDMEEPCIIDIKIGKQTWDSTSTPDAIERAESSYRECKLSYGFCIPGFQVHDIKTAEVKRFGKDYGKKLDKNTVLDALKMFLNGENQLSKLLLVKFLSLLRPIQVWAQSQTSLRLYDSSLLMVYDAKHLRSHLLCDCTFNTGSNLVDDCKCASGAKDWAVVKMIDFAHAFPAEDASIDTNYLAGVENLTQIFEQFLRQ